MYDIVTAKQIPRFLPVIPAKAGICRKTPIVLQIPAFAGMTDREL
jgi:hypothetical protein